MKKVKTARKTKKLSTKQLSKMNIKTVKKWMTCSTSNCSNETLVEEDVVAVKCSLCTLALAPLPKHLMTQKKKSEKPAGWRFMALFVDKDGNVFHTGVEQPKLKGTLKPSDVEKIREDQKKKRAETKKKKELRAKLKEERLAKQHVKAQKAKKKAQLKKDIESGKVVKKKAKKKVTKKKVTKGKVRYEKFEEPRIATDREQIQSLIEAEGIFAEKLATRQISIDNIQKIARTSYAAIDNQTGVVKNKRRGYKISLETGDTKIINISVK